MVVYSCDGCSNTLELPYESKHPSQAEDIENAGWYLYESLTSTRIDILCPTCIIDILNKLS